MSYSQFSELWNFPALATVCLIAVSGLIVIHIISVTVTSIDVRPHAYLAITVSTLFLLYRIYIGEIVELDERVWHELAAEASAVLSGPSPSPGALGTLPPGKEGYVWILGWAYVISGPAPMVPIVLNIILHGILTIILARTAEVFSLHLAIDENSRVSAVRFVALTTAVVPSIVLWVPLVLRETLCLLCIALALLFALHLVATWKVRFLVFLTLPTTILIWVRGSIGLALLAGLLLGLSFSWLRNRPFQWVGRFFLSIPVAVALFSLWFAVDSQSSLDASDIATRSVDLSTTASSGFPGIRASSSIMDIILIQGPRVAFGPFLWEFRPIAVMFLAFIEAVSWLACLFLALKSRPFMSKHSLHRALGMLVASVAIVLLLALAISIGNYGSLARLRPMVFVVLLPLAGVGYARIKGLSLQKVA